MSFIKEVMQAGIKEVAQLSRGLVELECPEDWNPGQLEIDAKHLESLINTPVLGRCFILKLSALLDLSADFNFSADDVHRIYTAKPLIRCKAVLLALYQLQPERFIRSA